MKRNGFLRLLLAAVLIWSVTAIPVVSQTDVWIVGKGGQSWEEPADVIAGLGELRLELEQVRQRVVLGGVEVDLAVLADAVAVDLGAPVARPLDRDPPAPCGPAGVALRAAHCALRTSNLSPNCEEFPY